MSRSSARWSQASSQAVVPRKTRSVAALVVPLSSTQARVAPAVSSCRKPVIRYVPIAISHAVIFSVRTPSLVLTACLPDVRLDRRLAGARPKGHRARSLDGTWRRARGFSRRVSSSLDVLSIPCRRVFRETIASAHVCQAGPPRLRAPVNAGEARRRGSGAAAAACPPKRRGPVGRRHHHHVNNFTYIGYILYSYIVIVPPVPGRPV